MEVELFGTHRCDRGTVLGPWLSESFSGGERFFRADCKKLACKKCGPKQARRYRRAIATCAERMRLTRMMTLTLDPAKVEGDSVAYLRDCFSKFRVLLHRRFREAISFIAVVELQKSGRAHLHVLIGRYIPQQWISDSWDSVGGGRIVDVRHVDVHRVNAYLSKYLTKDLLLSVPAKKKRISTSRDIKLFENKKAEGYRFCLDRIEHFWAYSREPGIVIVDYREDEAGVVSFIRCCREPG